MRTNFNYLPAKKRQLPRFPSNTGLRPSQDEVKDRTDFVNEYNDLVRQVEKTLRVVDGPLHPVRIWLNLCSTSEVDALHGHWKESGATISSAPEQKPWRLYESTAEDCDGNSYRVFHDTATTAEKG